MAGPPDEFAGVLRELRAHARLTQQDLADAAGLSLRTVSDRGVKRSAASHQCRLDLVGSSSAGDPDEGRTRLGARGRGR
jgi:hypothetical protein